MKKTILNMSAVFLACSSSFGAVSINSASSSITENFNSLISSGSGTFSDNTTLNGWIVNSEELDTDGDQYIANDGGSTGGEVYSYGASSDLDRALGYLGSGGNDYFNAAYSLVNDTGATITDLFVSYTGEQWRLASSGNQNILSFSYRIFAAESGSVPSSLSQTSWSAVNSLDFSAPQTAPQPGETAGKLNGNAAINQTSFSNISLGGITLDNGDEIWLRWSGNNGSGTDAGLAIDDVSISVTAIPEPSSCVMLGLGAMAFLLYRRK
ncbi:MAG: PEP-CTERM sorting domain-containing protein [Akkermansiaceae bacterium]|nr:PEP-CTERM sorting domain-containing protein [Akkermansiaceae bacterium]